MKVQTGYTLIELMIVLSLLAIVVAVAVPSYANHVIRSNRSEGIEALMSAAACQERLFIRNNAFNADACEGESRAGHYIVAVATENGNQNYVLTATPQKNQVKDSCGVLTLNDRGIRTANAQGGELARTCWAGRWGVAASS